MRLPGDRIAPMARKVLGSNIKGQQQGYTAGRVGNSTSCGDLVELTLFL